jgi:hypothetical protein
MKLTLVTLSLALLAGCGPDLALSEGGLRSRAARDVQSFAESDGWRVTAHTPELVGDGLVQGSATYDRTSGLEQRLGGVCLLANLSPFPACDSDADCSGLPVPPGGARYCVGINGSEPKQCWTRPSNNCTRRPLANPIHAGETLRTPAVPAVFEGRTVKWISFGCMANADNLLGCADLTRSVKATSFALFSGDDDE